MSSPFDALLADAWGLHEKGRQALRTLREIGDVEVGQSTKTLIHSENKAKLYRYQPLARALNVPPLFICYAMVNRPYMLDLQPDRSLIRELLFLGVDVYLLDWGYADGADRLTTLDDYICGTLARFVDFALAERSIDALNLLGICQGGTFALCYAALEPSKIANLLTMVTPVDFKTPENLLSKWVQHIDLDLLTQSGNVSGELLNAIFLALMPFKLTQQKYVNLLHLGPDRAQLENFMRMEKWIFDSPDQPATAFRQFVQWFFKENRLLRGELELGGRSVLLKNITCPVYNIYAQKDHLVPPSASIPLGAHVGSTVYDSLAMDVGHIGMYVSGKARSTLPNKIVARLLERR